MGLQLSGAFNLYAYLCGGNGYRESKGNFIMGVLSGAMPRQKNDQGTQVKSDYGSYRGFFIGMTQPVEWVSQWGDKCRVCKGARTGRNGQDDCFFCHGSGLRTEQHVKLRYQLENGITEEEEVNFTLTGPGTGRDGTPLSPSTLFLRLRTLSGLRDADAAALDQWYSALPVPIKIPITVNIQDNKSATALKITDVMLRRVAPNGQNGPANRLQQAQPAPQAQVSQPVAQTQPAASSASESDETHWAVDSGDFDNDLIPF